MTVSARASFDVSQYISRPELPSLPVSELLLFAASRRQSVKKASRIAGLPAYDRPPYCFPVYISENFFVRLPRGIAYTHFPIVADPVYLESDPRTVHQPRTGTLALSYRRIVEAMEKQPYFVYDEADYTENLDDHEIVERRYVAAQVYEKVGMNKPIYARFKGQRKFAEVSADVLENGSAGWHRLQYSYRVNFRAIGGKALDHVLARHPMPDFMASSLPLSTDRRKQIKALQDRYRLSQVSVLDDPCSLQILFMLRGLNEAEETFLGEMQLGAGSWSTCFYSFPFGKHIDRGYWIGSGKYGFGLPITRSLLVTIGDASALGLVTRPESGRTALTDAGHAFLDIMHADNNDPDALLRFMDPRTMTIPGSEIERIDAWMMRFFRKMKTKVNEL